MPTPPLYVRQTQSKLYGTPDSTDAVVELQRRLATQVEAIAKPDCTGDLVLGLDHGTVRRLAE